MSKPLAGQIAIVTGASRGIGQGIALQLGEAGATVYVTGRKPSGGKTELEDVAKEITKRGGKGIAVYVDHGNMDEVKAFFEKFNKETNGHVDILVNNAYSAVQALTDARGKKFYELDAEMWDTVNNVGLRNHYFCSVYAARMMVKNGRGLIVNVSSPGGLRYLFNVAYGVGKAALDRMSADFGVELKDKNVTAVSLWPGYVKTQMVEENILKGGTVVDPQYLGFLHGETIEYSGKAVVALAADPNKITKTGRILHTVDLGNEYGFVDVDGKAPRNIRSVQLQFTKAGWVKTAEWIPQWIRIPGWLMVASSSGL